MREFKFRAWVPKWLGEPIMRDVYGIDFQGYPIIGVSSITVLKPDNSDYIHILSDDFVLMRYTGLKDKNGKEIYESDIIKWKRLPLNHTIPMEHKIAITKYDPMSIGVVFYGEDLTWRVNEESKNIRHLLINEFRECEVVGNIYSNPELLK